MAEYMERPGYIRPTDHLGNPMPSSEDLDEALESIVCPSDSYKDGVYWADLPRKERLSWIFSEDNKETKNELGQLWKIFKSDPIEPIRIYFRKYVVTGLGLFVEGYTLFSIGNLGALFKSVWPRCWKTFQVCNATWVAAVDYLEIVGIICGQIIVGIEADFVGRRFGSLQDAILLSLGTLMLICAWGVNLSGWVICYAWSLFVYGVGVGGEYPITGTRSLEQGGTGFAAQRNDKLHRGRSLVLAFLMQGWGQLVNQFLLIVFLLIFNGGGNAPYGKTATQWTYRLSFVFVLIVTLWLLYYRLFKAKRSFDNVIQKSKARGGVTGYDTQSLKLALGHYNGRILATAGGWFASDFFFYGNKLFQGQFINVIKPNANVMTGWLYNLINIGVQLIGYYLAALLIDHKLYGRVRMQSVGFFFIFLCFIIPAADYQGLTSKSGIHAFQALYYLSSFFTQFGPNCVTFLVAAEIYPASIRGTAHGISAASGKLGALAPAILYNYVGVQTRFWVVPWFGVLGCLLTVIFLPDTTGLDLKEQERYWAFVRAGKAEEYHGAAVHPRHLSFWEHHVLKRSKYYDAAKDQEMKTAELKELYAKVSSSRKKTGDEVVDETYDDSDASFISDAVSAFFDGKKKRTASEHSGETAVARGNENGEKPKMHVK